jgi:hypothetical protein
VRIQLRTSVVAAVVGALLLSLPAFASADARPSPGGPGRSPFSHAQARAVLDQVRAALAPAGHRRAATAPRTDVTLQLRDLRRALPALTPSERAAATSLLDTFPPPSASCGSLLGSPVIQTTHFCLHYSSANVTPEWAATTASTLEEVWNVEVGRLGFRPPLPDGDGLFDVYLQDLAPGLYGACAPAQSTRQSTASCLLDNDFAPSEYGGASPYDSLRVTAAHEFFHAIQFGYDSYEDTWFMEGSAVWAEEQVYGGINDYLQYLPFSAITRPRVPVDFSGSTSSDLYFRYGAVLFWKFLSESFHDPGIVRRIWERAVGAPYSLQAVTAALAERGWSFPRAFARFGVWNTEPAGSYGDDALFPAPAWWRTARLGRRTPGTGTRTVTLDHLTDAAMLIEPRRRLPKRTRLRILVTTPPLSRMPQATVQVRRRNGSVSVLSVPLSRKGTGAVTVRFDPRVVSAVVVTLTNASTRMVGCGGDQAARYSCAGTGADDHLVFGVRARLRTH